jgi:hypothetical protein
MLSCSVSVTVTGSTFCDEVDVPPGPALVCERRLTWA